MVTYQRPEFLAALIHNCMGIPVTYIALLRGINVAGKNPVKMVVLKEIFEEVGFQNVRTYVQSGNVIFRATEASADISQILESALQKKLGLAIPVVVRTKIQMEAVLRGNPFVCGTKSKSAKAIDVINCT